MFANNKKKSSSIWELFENFHTEIRLTLSVLYELTDMQSTIPHIIIEHKNLNCHQV